MFEIKTFKRRHKKPVTTLFVNDKPDETVDNFLGRIIAYLERYVGLSYGAYNKKYGETPDEKCSKNVPERIVISKSSYNKILDHKPDLIDNNMILGMRIKFEER